MRRAASDPPLSSPYFFTTPKTNAAGRCVRCALSTARSTRWTRFSSSGRLIRFSGRLIRPSARRCSTDRGTGAHVLALDEARQGTLHRGRNRCRVVSTGSNRSPCSRPVATASGASKTRLFGSAPPATASTSSHNRGVETVGLSRALSE